MAADSEYSAAPQPTRVPALEPGSGVPGAERCPACGDPNACRLAKATASVGQGLCWCEQTDIPAELIARLPGECRSRQCLCAGCVAEFQRARNYRPAVGPGDYYIEASGNWVFTEAYHRRRGYCCGNGCRHCPYEPATATPASA